MSRQPNPMKIYNLSLHYEFVREDPSERVDSPERIAAYMQDAFAINPEQEFLHLLGIHHEPVVRIREVIPNGQLILTKVEVGIVLCRVHFTF